MAPLPRLYVPCKYFSILPFPYKLPSIKPCTYPMTMFFSILPFSFIFFPPPENSCSFSMFARIPFDSLRAKTITKCFLNEFIDDAVSILYPTSRSLRRDAQSVKILGRMQKPPERCASHNGVVGVEQYGLAQLVVPRAKTGRSAFVGI